jgi:hypothetical protein
MLTSTARPARKNHCGQPADRLFGGSGRIGTVEQFVALLKQLALSIGLASAFSASVDAAWRRDPRG